MLGHEESKEHSPVSGGLLMFPIGLEVRTSVSLERVLYFVISPKRVMKGFPKVRGSWEKEPGLHSLIHP